MNYCCEIVKQKLSDIAGVELPHLKEMEPAYVYAPAIRVMSSLFYCWVCGKRLTSASLSNEEPEQTPPPQKEASSPPTQPNTKLPCPKCKGVPQGENEQGITMKCGHPGCVNGFVIKKRKSNPEKLMRLQELKDQKIKQLSPAEEQRILKKQMEEIDE